MGMMMQDKQQDGADILTQYSYWLVPAEPLMTRLRTKIAQLASAFDGVIFEPHVTIYSGTSSDGEAQTLTNKVARTFDALELTVLKLDCTVSYKKTLFVRLANSDAARAMFDMLKQGSAYPSDYLLDPHLSLLYKTLPPTTTADLCRTQEISQGPYRFDGLRVIETEIPLSRPEQIIRWRTVYDSPLGLR